MDKAEGRRKREKKKEEEKSRCLETRKKLGQNQMPHLHEAMRAWYLSKLSQTRSGQLARTPGWHFLGAEAVVEAA